jgi:hypothetical protein
MKSKLIGVFLIMFLSLSSQVGGRKLEKSNIIRRPHHKRTYVTWVYRKTKPGPIQEKEQPKLFKWNVTSNKRWARRILYKQNKLRAKKRVRGNLVFHKRKYF